MLVFLVLPLLLLLSLLVHWKPILTDKHVPICKAHRDQVQLQMRPSIVSLACFPSRTSVTVIPFFERLTQVDHWWCDLIPWVPPHIFIGEV